MPFDFIYFLSIFKNIMIIIIIGTLLCKKLYEH